MANGKIEKREEQHLHPRKKAICNKSAKLVLIIAADARCNKDDDYSLLLMYMSRIV